MERVKSHPNGERGDAIQEILQRLSILGGLGGMGVAFVLKSPLRRWAFRLEVPQMIGSEVWSIAGWSIESRRAIQ